jgi:hypothetical protein
MDMLTRALAAVLPLKLHSCFLTSAFSWAMSLVWLKREATGKARQAAANQGFMAPINGAPTVTDCPINPYQAVKPSSFPLAPRDRTKVARDMVNPVGHL